MDKKQIQKILESSSPLRVRNLPKVERAMEKKFEKPFICFEKVDETNQFHLFFPFYNNLIKISYEVYPSAEGFRAEAVLLGREQFVYWNLDDAASKEEIDAKNKMICEVSKHFFELLKEEKTLRLLAATGAIRLDEEIISFNIYGVSYYG